jgi:hypothetical protein
LLSDAGLSGRAVGIKPADSEDWGGPAQ